MNRNATSSSTTPLKIAVAAHCLLTRSHFLIFRSSSSSSVYFSCKSSCGTVSCFESVSIITSQCFLDVSVFWGFNTAIFLCLDFVTELTPPSGFAAHLPFQGRQISVIPFHRTRHAVSLRKTCENGFTKISPPPASGPPPLSGEANFCHPVPSDTARRVPTKSKQPIRPID